MPRTEARSMNLRYPIWIRQPATQECFPWD
jgi:hypothetical protein